MRARYAVVVALALCMILGLGVAVAKEKGAASPEVTIERGDVIANLVTQRDPDLWLLQKGASLLAQARNLIDEQSNDQAADVLNQLVEMELPDSYGADKLRIESYLALGNIWDDAPETALKAASYFNLAIEHMDVVLDAELVATTIRSISAIYAARGDALEVERLEALARQVESGTAPLELEVLSKPVIVSKAGTDDPGDDTCDAAVSVSLPHSEIMSIFPSGDHNWREFTLSETMGVRIETISTDIYGDDTNLRLYGGCSAGLPTDFIEYDEDGGVGFLSLIERELPAGSYWLDVGGYGNYETPDDFELSITAFVPPQPDEYEPDNELSLATRIGFRNNGAGEGNQTGRDNSQIQTHSIFPAGDIDFFKFSLSRANYVRMETVGAENPDTVMGFSNSGGLFLAVNDDKGGGDLTSKLEFCLPRGDWYVPVIAYSSLATFDYDMIVDVEYPCLFESEPNGVCGSGDEIEPGEIWSGLQTSGGVAENDWYSFTLDTEQFVSIETTGWDVFAVDTYLQLYDACGGTLLASDDDAGAGYLSKIDILLPAGTYHLNVTVSPFSVGASYPYSFSVEFSEPPLAEAEPNNSCAMANLVNLGDNLLASISPVGDYDYFMLTLAADTAVEIETSGPSGDTLISVADMSGATQYCCNDDGGEGLFSLVSYCLPAGTYCVGVKEYGNNGTIGTYNIEFRDVGSCTAGDPLLCPVTGFYCNPW